MNDLQNLVTIIDKLHESGIHFESKVKFISRFNVLDNKNIVLDALAKLLEVQKDKTKSPYYNGSFSNLEDVFQFTDSNKINVKLRYGFTYAILCDGCGMKKHVSINCVSNIIPKYCEDCQDKYHDQGS
jgi:hypothetical protein